VEIMLTVLNRLRGTYGYFSHVTGLTIGILFYLFTNDIYTALGLYVMYVFGESFGWGKWIGGVYRNYRGVPTASIVADEEGRNNGIHFIANLINPETKNYYRYCFTALWIRGFYWFALAMLPLVIGGYLDIPNYLVIAILIGYGFPISVKLGTYTTKKFNFKYMNDFWEHAEVWYGLMQDIALILIILNISMV
jgi:hypothetical protein